MKIKLLISCFAFVYVLFFLNSCENNNKNNNINNTLKELNTCIECNITKNNNKCTDFIISDNLILFDEKPELYNSDIVRLIKFTPISFKSTLFEIIRVSRLNNCGVLIKKFNKHNNSSKISFTDNSYETILKIIHVDKLASLIKITDKLKKSKCAVYTKELGLRPYFSVEIFGKNCNLSFVHDFNFKSDTSLIRLYKKAYQDDFETIYLHNELNSEIELLFN